MKYGLVLNDMRSSNIENIECVKVSNNRQELVDWYKEQLADTPYRDENWDKVFKKGSQLEWYNPTNNIEVDNDYWGGIYTFKDEASDEDILQFRLSKF